MRNWHLILILLLMVNSWACGTESACQPDPRRLVQAAIASGQRRVVIPAGIYRLSPEPEASVHLAIRKARNLEIIADGVTFVCTRRTRALQLDQCENLTLQGLTIDYDPLTFTQGRVIAIAKDKGWIDVKVDAGYPRMLYTRIVVYDPKTRFQKRYVTVFPRICSSFSANFIPGWLVWGIAADKLNTSGYGRGQRRSVRIVRVSQVSAMSTIPQRAGGLDTCDTRL